MCGKYNHDYRYGGGCDRCGEPREGRLPSSVPEARPRWAGAYSVALSYGGPEEGGWYGEIREHKASAMIRPDDDPMAVARELWRAFESDDDGRNISDSLATGAIVVYWEETPKEHDERSVGRYC